MFWPSFLPVFIFAFSVFVPEGNVNVSGSDVRICPPPAAYVNTRCSSGTVRRAFFFEDREFKAEGDVAEMDVDSFLGGRHSLPSVSAWMMVPVERDGKRGYLLFYQV